METPPTTPPPDIPVTTYPATAAGLSVLLPAVLIVLVVVGVFFLPRRILHSSSDTPSSLAETVSPSDTVSQFLDAVTKRNLFVSGQFILPSTDFSSCPAPVNPLSSAILPENSYRILDTQTESAGSLSYVTVSLDESGQSRLYQFILLSDPSPWKLIACRDLGLPISVPPEDL